MTERKADFQDSIFLSCIVLIAFVPHIRELGFYGQDWLLLRSLSMPKDQSLFGLFRALYGENVLLQPGKVLYQVSLYKAFGVNALGYHITNALVFLVNILLFYRVLRLLNHERLLCLAAAALYALLPHYSSVRFWMQGFVLNLCMTFYFLSLYCDLRSMDDHTARFWSWKITATLSLLCSVLIHPITIPLFLLNPVLIWYREADFTKVFMKWLKRLRYRRQWKHWYRRAEGSSEVRGMSGLTDTIRGNLRILFYINLAVLLPIINLKILGAIESGNTPFLHIIRSLFDVTYGNFQWGLNYVHAAGVAFGIYFFGLPGIVLAIIRDYSDQTVFLTTGALGIVAYGFLHYAQTLSPVPQAVNRNFVKLARHGAVVFFVGYAIYLIDINVRFSSTGVVNVTAIAAAMGVAMVLVGLVGGLATLLRPSFLKKAMFSFLVSLLLMTGFLINQTLAGFWGSANRQQHELLADICETLPTPAPYTSIIVDGICPYEGPAIVFEQRDLEAALRLRYGDNTLRANIVTHKLAAKEDFLEVSRWGRQRYAYNNLVILNAGQKKYYEMADADAVNDYLKTHRPNYESDCADGRPGFGEPIFGYRTLTFR